MYIGTSLYNFSDYLIGTENIANDPLMMLVFLILLMMGLVLTVVIVLVTIINWKILKKMGDNGWKALIPVYNTWCICEGIGVCPHWSWITFVATSVLHIILPGIGSLLASAIGIYFQIIYFISLSRAFGKDDGFAVLMLFFFPIVGFFLVKNEYVGANPCRDFVFDEWIQLNNKNQEATVVNETRSDETTSDKNVFCSNCGKKIDENIKFCPYCGTEVKK